MTISKHIAHVKLDNETGDWLLPRDLMEHLESVAQQAGLSAASFGSFGWCYAAGLWHEMGKYHAPFQYYIRDTSGFEREKSLGRVTHSTVGESIRSNNDPVCPDVVLYDT